MNNLIYTGVAVPIFTESSPAPAKSRVAAFEEVVSRQLNEMERSVRRSPRKAVVVAAAAGYMLRHVPVGSLVRSTFSLALNLLPAALVVAGAAKLYDALPKEAGRVPYRGSRQREEREGRESLLIIP